MKRLFFTLLAILILYSPLHASWTFNPHTRKLDYHVGPTSSTDHAIPRYDETTGRRLLDSGVLIDNSNNITLPTGVWLGLGAAAGRMEVVDAATDYINFAGCRVGVGIVGVPSGILDVEGTTATYITRDTGAAGVNTPQSAIQIGLKGSNIQNGGGPSFLFFADNDAEQKEFLGRLSAVWENNADGSEAGSIAFNVRKNAADTFAQSEAMRINSAGNVIIGAETVGTNAAKTMAISLGTDPTADVANQFAFWAKDFAAGNTVPYFRTENGTVIGLNQSYLTTDAVEFTALGLAIETVTGNTTLDATHSTLLVNASGNVIITAPTAASAYNATAGIGRIYNIKKIDADADTVTVDGDGAELIDGAATAVLTVQNENITIQTNGTAWFIH